MLVANTIAYLSGVRCPELDAMACNEGDYGILPALGVLVQPLTTSYLNDAASYYELCGIDNGCFTETGRRKFSMSSYERLAKTALDKFGPAPDTPFDWAKTLESSLPTLQVIRSWDCPAAIVWQDGATVENMPWDAFDVGFIGGSTEWKLGLEAEALTKEAIRRGKRVHMGRVNSSKRMLTAQRFGCYSADGTYLLHELKKGVSPMAACLALTDWLRDCFVAKFVKG